MAITRNVKNPKTGKFESVKISTRELKRTIMSANNWNEEQYRKQYDIFKNKLRFYEEVQRSRGLKDYQKGGDKEKQSPQELLYKIARAKQRYGKDYQPSQEVEEILAMTAHSISKGKNIAKQASGKSYNAAVSKVVSIRFKGFVDFYDKAAEIVEKITDPVQQEAALVAFATYLHETQPRTGKDKGAPKPKTGAGGFVQGETHGSGDADDGGEFDFSQWLDEDENNEGNDEEEE